MEIYKSRPLCVIITLSLLTVFGCAFISASVGLFVSVGAAVLSLAYVFTLKSGDILKRRLMTVILAVFVITFSGIRGHFFFLERIELDDFTSDGVRELTGEVEEIYFSRTYGSALKLKITEIDGEEYSERAYCSFLFETDYRKGDIVRFEGHVFPRERMLDEGFYTWGMMLSEGFTLYVESEYDGAEYLGRHVTLKTKLEDFNNRLSASFRYYLGDNAGGLASALALGNQSHVSEMLERDFRRCGLAHILALSGSHIVLIIGAVDKFFFASFLAGKKCRSIIMLLTVPLYVMLVTSPVPVVRAGLMYMITCTAALFGRKGDSITSLFLSVYIMVMAFPSMLFSVSMWMSFLATLALVVFMPPIYASMKAARQKTEHKMMFDCFGAVFYAVIMCILGTVSNIVFSYATFGSMSMLALPANVIFGPILTFLLVCYMLFLLLLPVPTLASLLAVPLKMISESTIELLGRISAQKYSEISLFGVIPGIICISVFVLFGAFIVLKVKSKRIVIAFALIASVALSSIFVIRYADRDTELLLDVRNDNDMTYVRVGDDFSIIDCSNGRFTNLFTISNEAKKAGASEFSSIVLTHYHRYHVSAISRFFEREIVRALVLPTPVGDTDIEVFDKLSSLAVEHGVPVTVADGDTHYKLCEGVYIKDISHSFISRSTHPTVAYSLIIKDESLLYIGASVHERDVDITTDEYDKILLGRHGPKPKSEFSYEISDTCEVFVLNRDVLSLISDDSRNKMTGNGERGILFPDGVRISFD